MPRMFYVLGALGLLLAAREPAAAADTVAIAQSGKTVTITITVDAANEQATAAAEKAAGIPAAEIEKNYKDRVLRKAASALNGAAMTVRKTEAEIDAEAAAQAAAQKAAQAIVDASVTSTGK